MNKKQTKKREEQHNQRAKEFLACLGNGKTIYQIESEEALMEEEQNGNS